MHQPHPDSLGRDDLPAWVAVAVARPASRVAGMRQKNIFRRSHLEKSANNHRRFDGAFCEPAGRPALIKPQQPTPKMKRPPGTEDEKFNFFREVELLADRRREVELLADVS
jgi:hypothetical protein